MLRRNIAWISVGLLCMGLVLGLGGPELYGLTSYAQSAPVPKPGCTPNVVPAGQSNPPGSQLEPLAPIWCFDLAAPGAPTRKTGANDWVDTFDTVTQMGRFADGDYDYRIFDRVQNGPGFRAQHFTNNQHWMDDNAGGFTGGTMLRPNRSFTFENGMLVVEQDVAAGISAYAGAAWPEIDISTAPQPTGVTVDNLYGYGQFGGHWTFGCRLHSLGNPICSLENAASNVTNTNNARPCFRSAPARVMEISDFEICGATHFGGNLFGDGANFFRLCNSVAQSPDMLCRDRFRLELTANDFKLYVNGHLYFEDGDWPATSQIDANAIANGQWYVYATDWEDRPTEPAYRYHWRRFAVNPHNPDGSIASPSAAPTFCPGQPGNTCMAGMTAGPTSTATATPTLTPSPVLDSATATPTLTPSPVLDSATATPTLTPSPVLDSATSTPTPSPVLDSATSTPTPTPVTLISATSTPSPTPTLISATSTPTPTPTLISATSTPSPTPTLISATSTPTPTSTPVCQRSTPECEPRG